MAKATLIVSGGMDSSTLAYYYDDLGYDLHLVGFNYGQRHKKELEAVEKIARNLNATHELIDLSSIKQSISTSALTNDDIDVPEGHYTAENMAQTVVPNRNAIMLSIATGIGVANGSEVVATGVHAGDHAIYPDCREEFIESISESFQLGTEGHSDERFRVEAPFVRMMKDEIAEVGYQLNVPYEITWSCYKGGDLHCGRCGTCVERIEAFILAMVPDPTEYETGGFEYALSQISND